MARPPHSIVTIATPFVSHSWQLPSSVANSIANVLAAFQGRIAHRLSDDGENHLRRTPRLTLKRGLFERQLRGNFTHTPRRQPPAAERRLETFARPLPNEKVQP